MPLGQRVHPLATRPGLYHQVSFCHLDRRGQGGGQRGQEAQRQRSASPGQQPEERPRPEGAHGHEVRASHPVLPPASEWVPVNARPVMLTQQTIRNLAVGDKFFVRVAAVSSAGAGPPAVLSQPVHIPEIIGKAFLLLPPHLAGRREKRRPMGRGTGRPLPHPNHACTGHMLFMLSPSRLEKVPGPSAARDFWRSKRPCP